MIFITIFIILLCLFGLSWFSGTDAPYVPTQTDSLELVLKWCGVKGKKFWELGSGDGRVVFAAARLGADGVGVEQSLLRVLYSRYKAKKLKLNCDFIHDNIFNINYSKADVVYIYLLPKAVFKLETKLQKELKANSQIITQRFHFKTLKPYKKIDNFWIYQV